MRAGLGGAVAPVVVRLTLPDAAAARARLSGPGAPNGWAWHGGVQLRWHGQEAELTADPYRCDDRSIAQLSAVLAGGAGPEGRRQRQAPPAPGIMPPGAVRLPLSAEVVAALEARLGQDGSIHDAYGTQPLDIAAAAVFDALSAAGDQVGPGPGQRAAAAQPEPGQPAAAQPEPSQSAGMPSDPVILLADCGAGLAVHDLGQFAVPAAVRLAAPAASTSTGPEGLLQATKAAIRDARRDAAARARRR